MFGPFERETLLDVTVNVIPLAIILFFIVLFLAYTPWEQNLFVQTVSLGLLVIPLVLLALLTYVSGLAVQEAEEGESPGQG